MDLRRGAVVRLRKGVDGSEEHYPFGATEWIERLVAAGACRIHLVDLDGAFGEQRQRELLDFPKRFANVCFQLGGGLRDRQSVERVLDAGFVAVVGTLAVTNPSSIARLDASKIVLALDVLNQRVMVRGWQHDANVEPEGLFKQLVSMGFEVALVTDIERDGMLQGPGILAAKWVGSHGFSVQASGGLTSLDDLTKLASEPCVIGAISGKALLDGLIALDDPRTKMAFEGTW
jgi:phosphoribosylformimino-5-aminoimidazole carboxamide ribonucleotide (ProFAR) isomerase